MIAWLIGKGHVDAYGYRLDFVKTVIEVLTDGPEEKRESGAETLDNDEVLKEVFG